MVHLSTCLILSTVFLLAQVFHPTQAKVCCKGDSTCSGCWLCPTSSLRECWDDAVYEIDNCHITDNLKESAYTFCKGFAKLAKCWKPGRCCSEYSPLLAAAENLCNLKTWSSHHITRDQLEKFVGIANTTRSKIWHNDSGRDVPKLTATVKAYDSDSSASSESDSYQSQSTSHTTSYNEHSRSTQNSHSYYQKSVDSTESDNEVDPSNYHGHEQTTVSHFPQPRLQYHKTEHHSQHKEYSGKHPNIVHHQARCGSKPNKCQPKTAAQYHNARSTTHKSHAKRVGNHLHKRAPYHKHNPEVYKRTEEGDHGCGLDFQGVPYPKEVPDTVARMFAEL